MHFGFDASALVIITSSFPDGPAKPPACTDDLIAGRDPDGAAFGQIYRIAFVHVDGLDQFGREFVEITSVRPLR